MNVSEICKKAHDAQYALGAMSAEAKNSVLKAVARAIKDSEDALLAANALDINFAGQSGMAEAMIDRLLLTNERIELMAEGVEQVSELPDPVGEVSDSWQLDNGLRIEKVRAPLGVIGVIYEARPNVTADVFALCFKSGNCVVLRGGKEAINSNRAIYKVIADTLTRLGCDGDVIGFIDDTSREGSAQLLKQGDTVDVIIPRGGDGLKKFVLDNAVMPVIASAGGVCHIYVERTADIDKSIEVIDNAKMQRPSVCNALEQLLVHAPIADKLLPKLAKALGGRCKIVGCARTCDILKDCGCDVTLAKEEDYKKEYHDYALTVRVVDSTDEAIDIVNANNTKHSDAIMSEDKDAIAAFTSKVDAGCIYVNASTRFTDGFQFGFGAEIAISTQKLHARGPLGLRQLTSEKYVVRGDYTSRK